MLRIIWLARHRMLCYSILKVRLVILRNTRFRRGSKSQRGTNALAYLPAASVKKKLLTLTPSAVFTTLCNLGTLTQVTQEQPLSEFLTGLASLVLLLGVKLEPTRLKHILGALLQCTHKHQTWFEKLAKGQKHNTLFSL